MENNLKKGLVIAGILASEVPDKTAETISVDGMDISSLNDGTAVLNSEHNSGNFSNYLGRIVKAKKIFSKEDCETAHEKQCFQETGENPLIYGTVELFDDEEGHTEAKHAAAIIKAYKKRGLPIAAKFSIEGQSLVKNGPEIKRSVARKVALTIQPANASCELDIVSGLNKSEQQTYEVLKKAKSGPETLCSGPNCDLLVLDPQNVTSIVSNLSNSLQKLQKALEAGMAVGAPGSLTQGASLQGKKKPLKKEESSEETEETSEVSKGKPHEETTLIDPLDKEKAKEVDEKVKGMDLKLKKTEIFVLKALTALMKSGSR